MIKLLLFLLLLLPASQASLWLADHPGTITITMLDTNITISTGFAAMVLAACLLLIAIASIALWALLTWPERRHAARTIYHYEHGLTHITRGLSALSSSQQQRAQKELKKAAYHLKGSPLPYLLSAQAKLQSGHDATVDFEALLAHESTAYIGLKALIEHAQRHADTAKLDRLLHEAKQQFPRNGWVLNAWIRRMIARGEFARALSALPKFCMKHPLSIVARRGLRAHIYDHMAGQPGADRLGLLKKAHHDAPGFTPATLAYAQEYQAQGKPLHALRLLRKQWAHTPHRMVAAAVLALTESWPVRKQLRAETHAIAAQLAAKLHLRLGNKENALTHAKRAIELSPGQSGFLLMADIVRLRDGIDAAQHWIKEAIQAPRDEIWQCTDCGHVHAHWQLLCEACGQLDSVQWQTPTTTSLVI
jgi:HemY protein